MVATALVPTLVEHCGLRWICRQRISSGLAEGDGPDRLRINACGSPDAPWGNPGTRVSAATAQQDRWNSLSTRDHSEQPPCGGSILRFGCARLRSTAAFSTRDGRGSVTAMCTGARSREDVTTLFARDLLSGLSFSCSRCRANRRSQTKRAASPTQPYLGRSHS
jgi:hypothetical protein